jgi:subtilisin family serine protease
MIRINRKGTAGLTVVALTAIVCFGPSTEPATGLESATHAPVHASKLTPAMHEQLGSEAGPYKVWIFFRDKGIASQRGYDAAIAEIRASFAPRAIKRRQQRGHNAARNGALFDARDLPVAEAYVDAARAAGADVQRTSRWVNAASAFVNADEIQAIAALPFVTRIQPVACWAGPEPIDMRPLEPQPAQDGTPRTIDYGAATGQLQQINLIALHEAGYTGDGVIIGILDTGFKRTHTAFNQPGHEVTVLAEYDFVDDDPNTAPEPGDPSSQHRHGTLILGCIGAFKPGDLVGGAFDAEFILAKTEDTTGEYQAEEDNYVAGLEFIEMNGADMSTSSLGYIDWYTQQDLDGETAVTTIAMNIANDNGLHACTAAGNEYHDSNPNTSSLIAPADAFRVITCGAVTSGGSMASFSSDGPTADGRVKPEVLALGSGTSTVDPFSDSSYTTASGTSLSTPLVAAAVACLIQARPEWTVDELRDALFHTSDYYVEHETHDPLFVRGYGIINALGAIQDCNENGIPDLIEIANGDAFDCNGNGVLDECDLAEGTAEDCNENGVPDICDITPPGRGVSDEYAAVVGWEEISGSGTPLNLSDDGEATVNIPFASPAFESMTITVGNNGAIGFIGGGSLPYVNENVPTGDAFGGAQSLFAFWDDIDSDTGNVYYETVGTEPSRVFVVEWHDRPHFPGDTVINGDEVTFQIQIFETPVDGVYAQFLYEDVIFEDGTLDNGASATIGYQDDADNGDEWSYNQPVINAGDVLSVVALGEAFSQDENSNGIPDECEGLPCPEDLDGSGDVDVTDLLDLLAAWGQSGVPADLDGSGIVDVGDLLQLLAAWGVCP